MRPSPVAWRCISAARIPITQCMPVPESPMDGQTKVGGPSAKPVTLMPPPMAWAEEDIAGPHESPKDLLRAGALEVQLKAPLIGIEREEEKAVAVRSIPMRLAGDVAPNGFLDLDDVGPQPRQHLAARGPGLMVREVDHSDARQGLRHGSL
jgi:hypothetical protein